MPCAQIIAYASFIIYLNEIWQTNLSNFGLQKKTIRIPFYIHSLSPYLNNENQIAKMYFYISSIDVELFRISHAFK